MTTNSTKAWIFLGLFFILSSCQNQEAELVKISGRTMGTTYNISYTPFTTGASTANDVKQEVDKILERVNDLMSTYRPNSQISKFNSFKLQAPYKIDREFFKVVSLAQEISKQSAGAFDITVGPIVNLWGFGPTKRTEPPSSAVLDQWKNKVGFNNLKLDSDNLTISKNHSDIYIDLSAIAKGYGVDAVAAYFESIQAVNYMVEIGGELRVKGLKNGKSWNIGITRPGDDGSSIQKILKLSGHAMATSGNYRNYFVKDGKRFSHTIDPLTLRPVDHQLASVTVITNKSCARADALATTLMVLGPKKGLIFANQHHLSAYFIYHKNGILKELYSTEFLKLISE